MSLFNWGKKKEKEPDPLDDMRELFESAARENQLIRDIALKAKQQAEAMQRDMDARMTKMIAAEEKSRQAAADFQASSAPGGETAIWLKSGCPTQNAVAISKPLTFGRKG
jgi:hypothetical protein